ncbi:MAG: SigB/SigF/SigG family RNA polymerase sigma factor [Clostridiales Family XIII bacterium]|jgi:RNA polymerase sigma-B factor|nr:SigB/SigF/SigG family RNA polymerase sigma factor [Clostridiales Family XIII bacterium]
MALTSEQEKKVQQLFQEYAKNRDTETRNRIVEYYLFLVDILVKKYLNKGIDYEDLYQVGSLALVFAVERFDSTKGFGFSSFATPTIIGEIKRYFRDKGWAVKVPRRVKEIVLELQSTKEELTRRQGRPPTIPELASVMQCSEEEILEAMESSQSYSSYSLNQTFENEDGDSTGDQNKYDRFTSVKEAGYESFENAEFIQNVTKRMSEREKRIFSARLLQEKTQIEVAEMLGVSQMMISRLEGEIKKKFRAEYYRCQ